MGWIQEQWIGAEVSLCPASTDAEYRDGSDAFTEYSS
jgi:hypothetical protein